MNASCEREVYHNKELHWVADAAALSKSDLIIIWILTKHCVSTIYCNILLYSNAVIKKTGKAIYAENV